MESNCGVFLGQLACKLGEVTPLNLYVMLTYKY